MRYPASGSEPANAIRPREQANEIIRIVGQFHLPVKRTPEQSELSPRELALRLTGEKRYFVPEAMVYRRLKAQGMSHVRGAPLHPQTQTQTQTQTQGKIERWHQTLKNRSSGN